MRWAAALTPWRKSGCRKKMRDPSQAGVAAIAAAAVEGTDVSDG